MTKTIALAQLAKQDTATLVAQYDAAVSAPLRRRYQSANNPLQRRINVIVDLLSERADKDDAVALAWYASTED